MNHIVHGFVQTSFNVTEGEEQNILFELNIKGKTSSQSYAEALFSGQITKGQDGTVGMSIECVLHCKK